MSASRKWIAGAADALARELTQEKALRVVDALREVDGANASAAATLAALREEIRTTVDWESRG